MLLISLIYLLETSLKQKQIIPPSLHWVKKIYDDLLCLFVMLNVDVDQYSVLVLTCVGWTPYTDNLINERTQVERKVVKVYLVWWRCEVSLTGQPLPPDNSLHHSISTRRFCLASIQSSAWRYSRPSSYYLQITE